MTVERKTLPRRPETAPARKATIARRVAAVAGAAGAAGAAMTGEANAEAITLTPTAGVLAAQGITGFSFTSPTTITPGTLRPPTTDGATNWDVDGDGFADFELRNGNGSGVFFSANFWPNNRSYNSNALLVFAGEGEKAGPLANISGAQVIGAAGPLNGSPQIMTVGNQATASLSASVANFQSQFTSNQPGYFGFRFAASETAEDYYYGWGSLTIEPSLDTPGYGFKITQAFYQSNGSAITLGAVPVPEPSSMALLAVGAAGVAAWRARKKKQPAT